MGKRSDFPRNKHDFYPTPLAAVKPLVAFLNNTEKSKLFVEPCVGDGSLMRHLESAGFRCMGAFDISPRDHRYPTLDALQWEPYQPPPLIITNPPWTREILHPMIEKFSSIATTWLLIDADWPHTKQSINYIQHCTDILPIGRVKWIEDSPYTGKDNCCWYRFSSEHSGGPHFHPRQSDTG